jgi:hypothetical protein
MAIKKSCIKAITYSGSVRYSEQTGLSLTKCPTDSLSNAHPGRNHLVKQALLRDQLQAKIKELIRDYEITSRFHVVRANYSAEHRDVIIDAIPAAR